MAKRLGREREHWLAAHSSASSGMSSGMRAMPPPSAVAIEQLTHGPLPLEHVRWSVAKNDGRLAHQSSAAVPTNTGSRLALDMD